MNRIRRPAMLLLCGASMFGCASPQRSALTTPLVTCGEGTILEEGRCEVRQPTTEAPCPTTPSAVVLPSIAEAAPTEPPSSGPAIAPTASTAPASAVTKVEPTKAPPPVAPRMGRTDYFLLSDMTNTDVYIDGSWQGSAPVKTFLLSPGDHIIQFKPKGIDGCRVTLRNTEVGQSITIKAMLADGDADCARIQRLPTLGKMADF